MKERLELEVKMMKDPDERKILADFKYKFERKNFNIKIFETETDKQEQLEKNLEEEAKRAKEEQAQAEKDAIKELELGHAQFGVASADQVIRAVSKGAPIVVIAQLFQINPLHWIYRPDKTPLKTPQDLKGKTIGITFG